MNILVDMNLTPKWVKILEAAGYNAVHWSTVGKANATDREIMDYAVNNDHVVFTHDLDFGTILAVTDARGPSVIQVRTQDTTPDAIADMVLKAIHKFQTQITEGALISIDPKKMKARILPLKQY